MTSLIQFLTTNRDVLVYATLALATIGWLLYFRLGARFVELTSEHELLQEDMRQANSRVDEQDVLIDTLQEKAMGYRAALMVMPHVQNRYAQPLQLEQVIAVLEDDPHASIREVTRRTGIPYNRVQGFLYRQAQAVIDGRVGWIPATRISQKVA